MSAKTRVRTDRAQQVVLFNKPYGVLCQFKDDDGRPTLGDFVDTPGVYPAGRLDRDSEGLVVLTANGRLQHRITDPAHKLSKVYWVQVEGEPNGEVLRRWAAGVELVDGLTRAADVRRIAAPPDLWPRDPPIRTRKTIPTTWVELCLREGRNRQVRRMTAHLGFPTLRLVRVSVGDWRLGDLLPGQSIVLGKQRSLTGASATRKL